MTHPVDTKVAVIGAGPSGLSAAYELTKRGISPEILERTDRVGGLMRSIPKHGYILDIGRKEMYSRIPEVVSLWDALMGEDYRVYPHRVGSLYNGQIVEISGQFRGILRGVPLPLLIRGAISLVKGRAVGLFKKPGSFQEHWHFKVGEVFARLFAQGYWEKFRGTGWADMPVPQPDEKSPRRSYSQKAVSAALRVARRDSDEPARVWRHPRLGTGQLFDRLHEEIGKAGGAIRFGTEVQRIEQQPSGAWKLDVVEGDKKRCIVAANVISGLSVERLSKLLFRGDKPLLARSGSRGPVLYETRHVLLVYLFLDAMPPFPHAWLEVNDPNLQCGRITSYNGFNGDMVPEGKTCLCVEFFCSEKDEILTWDDAALTELALAECSAAGVVDDTKVDGSWVMRLARTNAASSWRELQSEERRELLEQLKPIPTFFHVNRPGCDWASLAGLFAGRAVATGCRKDFDTRADPTQRLPELRGAETNPGGAQAVVAN